MRERSDLWTACQTHIGLAGKDMKYFLLSTSLMLMASLALGGCQPASDEGADIRLPTEPSVVTAAYAVPFTKPRSFDYMSENAILVFSATRDWRHDSGIAGAAAFWARITDEAERGLFITEHPGVFTDETLSKFNVIVMNSATGDVLSASQQAAIERFVEGGGGLIAQHAMGDSSLAKIWPWWETQLGTEFISHPADPQFQMADVVTLARGHPVMAGLGAKFEHSDEWYSFTGPVAGEVVVLAGLDESTYSPFNKVYGVEDLRMGPNPSDHPIIWAKCPGEGRIVYSALGHKADSYDSAPHRLLLTNALAWVSADETGCP